jgi:chromosome segregation ATPase
MTTATMTTEEIAPEIESKRARARELTAQKEKLQHAHAGAIATVSKAIAAGRGGEGVAAARKVARSAGDEIAEIDGAIEVLLKETAQLERDRKVAEKHEAVERANKSAIQAASAIEAFRAKLREVAGTIRDLKAETDRAMYEANRDDGLVKSLNGQAPGIFERFVWVNTPGIEDLVKELVKIV